MDFKWGMWEDFEEEKRDKFKEVRVEGYVVDFYIKSIKIVLFKVYKNVIYW